MKQGILMFKCEKCEYMGMSKAQLRYHTEIKHTTEIKLKKNNQIIIIKKNEEGKFKCSGCGKTSRTVKTMKGQHKKCKFNMVDKEVETDEIRQGVIRKERGEEEGEKEKSQKEIERRIEKELGLGLESGAELEAELDKYLESHKKK